MPASHEAAQVRRIAVFAYPDVNSLDVVGPLQAFASADRYMRRFLPAGAPHPGIRYLTEIVGREAGAITTSAGFAVVASHGIDGLPADIDTLLIAGGDGNEAVCGDAITIDWLKEAAPHVRRVGSICTGAFILAAAGLLDQRRATTHWRACADLAQQHPAVSVEPDALHVRDGHVYTSAGVTAGMDLALALVEEDCGRKIALATAREMVAFLKRPGGQSQFSSHLEAQSVTSPALSDVQSWIVDNLTADLSVDALAREANMSARTFARAFVRETGTTPAKFVERARVDAARRALEETTEPVATLAHRLGFGHAETMRRVFLRHLNVGPQDYRRRFQSTPAALAS